jgi:photosystem II stability/assembly factor-like uncharacterized protein
VSLLPFVFIVVFNPVQAQVWVPQQSGTSVSLRGISAVSPNVAWASGAKGSYLRTRDGGASWEFLTMPGAADLDFRDVEGFDDRTAILLSSGSGPESRLYRTRDGGATWSLTLTNPDPKGFWDAMAFWDSSHGIVLGDPVDGHFVILTTSDGGMTWQHEKGPPAYKDEAAFAASGSCITTRGAHEVWFGTGGPEGGRVFHSTDGGKSWSAARTPLRTGTTSGVFSLAFSDSLHGIAAGGDYKMESDSTGTLAVTKDGGKTWTIESAPSGFRSSVAYVPQLRMWISVGTTGSDVSNDGGITWRPFGQGFNAVSFAAGSTGWAVGPGGSIAKFRLGE